MFAIGQSNFLQALGWAVLNSLWQMALLWVVYQLATALLRTNKSSTKGFLATVLLFSGFAWFVFTFFSILADRPASETGYSAFISISGNDSVNNWLYTMLPVASLVYLVLLMLPILNFIRNYRYVQIIRNHGLKKADVKWRMFAQKIAAQMGIVKSVQVWMSEFITSPVTIGYIKPIILLPVAAVNHLSAEQIEAVLLHELSHIKRFDYLINLITRIIQTILYFNPFVRAFAVIIEREREKNCDEIVLQFQYEPHGYASALLTLEKASYLPQPLAIAAADGKKNELLGRIESILGIQKKPVLSFNKLAGIMAALLCFISLNALLLLSKPGETNATPGLLTDLSGPFHLFTPGESMPLANQNKELKSIPVVNHLVEPPTEQKQKMSPAIVLIPKTASEALPRPAPVSPYAYVNFKENIIPELDEQKEEQVKEAIDASKKVFTEGQWKAMEKNIADAMTTHEKEKLKYEYQKAMSKLDWEKMENKLRIAYDNINWKEINTELNKALVEIKLDSIQRVYTTTISNLASLEKELVKCNEPGIPDTDITLQSVETKKREVLRVINNIKSARARKVVRL
ncbi:MAG: M56 family metallopeptidase [Chitinophagaceae bacterium]